MHRQTDRQAAATSRALGLALAVAPSIATSAAIGFALMLAGHGQLLLGSTSSAKAAATLLLLVGAGGALLLQRSLAPLLGAAARTEEEGEPMPRWLQWSIALALLLLVGTTLHATWRAPDGGWDAWSIWNSRARALLRSGGDVRLACAAGRGAALFTLHPEYPLLLPTMIALGWRSLGSETPLVPMLLGLAPALWLAAIGALVIARSSARSAGFTTLLLLTTPEFARMASAQYAELALSVLVMTALALLLLADELVETQPGRRWLLLLAGHSLGLAALVKHEGLVWLLACALVTLVSRRRDLLPFALGAALPLVLLGWFKHSFAPPSDLANGDLVTTLAHLPTRIGQTALGLVRRIVYVQAWGVHLLAVTAMLALRMHRRDLSRPALALLSICGVVLGGFLCAYLISPHELTWHLHASIDRLLLQLWPPALLALGLPQRVPARA